MAFECLSMGYLPAMSLGQQSLLLVLSLEAQLNSKIPEVQQFEQLAVPFGTLTVSRYSSRKMMPCSPRVLEN